MTVFLTATLLLHVKRSARLRLCASLAAGMSVSEHDLGHGQAAHTEHQHTQIAHAHTHSRTNRREEPVLQLSSHKNAAMQHLPTGLFFVLYNITTTKQTQNKDFISPIHCSVCSEASLYSLGSLDHSNLLSSSVSPLLSWRKAPKSFVLFGDGNWKKSGYQCLLIVKSMGSILITFTVSKLLCLCGWVRVCCILQNACLFSW